VPTNSTISIPATAMGAQIPRIGDNTIAELWDSSHLCMIYLILPIIVDTIPGKLPLSVPVMELMVSCNMPGLVASYFVVELVINIVSQQS
jgi:hypothetical protein